MITFPENFILGASISAHQVEGNNFNSDWWKWEQRPGRIEDGSTSQDACKHFTLYQDDFDLARKLGIKWLMFSVEWGRIEPEFGRFDDDAIAHYSDVLDALISHGINPIFVLQWNTLPAWFASIGGWSSPRAVELFSRYVQQVVKLWISKCRWWIPIYEPMRSISMGRLARVWPPGKRNPLSTLCTLRNMALAHISAWNIIHNMSDDVMVGSATRYRPLSPFDIHSPWDLGTSRREHDRCNHAFVKLLIEGKWGRIRIPKDATKRSLDFLGISYYGTEMVRFSALRPLRLFSAYCNRDGKGSSNYMPEYAPSVLMDVLSEMARYDLPILITGNGIATEDDNLRSISLLNHLVATNQAIEEDIRILGYIHHSFLDGFEWEKGYSARYGLVHIDRTTFARTPNNSAYLFKDICQTAEIRPGTIARFCPQWSETE